MGSACCTAATQLQAGAGAKLACRDPCAVPALLLNLQSGLRFTKLRAALNTGNGLEQLSFAAKLHSFKLQTLQNWAPDIQAQFKPDF